MDRKTKYTQIMLILQSANSFVRYPRDFTNPEIVKAWCEALEDLPISKLKPAMSSLVAKGDWPSLTEIREAVLGQDEETQIMSAEEAFGWTWTHLNGYEKPQLPPVLEKTIEKLGGWFHICNTWTNDREQVIGRNFKDVYNGVKQNFVNAPEKPSLPSGSRETSKGLVKYREAIGMVLE
jgi:hypothetical protein